MSMPNILEVELISLKGCEITYLVKAFQSTNPLGVKNSLKNLHFYQNYFFSLLNGGK